MILDQINNDGVKVSVVIEGESRGADKLAALWASRRSIPLEPYPADWDRWGMAAGPKRNRQMLIEGKPDLVVAFPGGDGTADMVRQARKAGVRVREVV
jgi:hypothetical protein